MTSTRFNLSSVHTDTAPPEGYYHNPRPEVVALVPTHCRQVVDVGCGAGAVGQAIKAARPEVQVRGVEPAPSPAAMAKDVLDDVLHNTAEAPLPADWPAPDCVIFADVLEHMVDPWSTLKLWRKRMRPGGCVIASIPNVAHHSVIADLLRGRFEYQNAGILDRTHLRFFTHRTALELVTQAGFAIDHFARLRGLEPARVHRRLSEWAEPIGQSGWSARLADFYTVQFLVRATC